MQCHGQQKLKQTTANATKGKGEASRERTCTKDAWKCENTNTIKSIPETKETKSGKRKIK